MISAFFEHLAGKEICSTPEEVRAVMAKMVDGGNAFNIYREQDAIFPYFSVLTQGEYAYIWYAPDESSAGIQAWGENLGLDPEGSVDFYIPELTVISNDYILTRETAVQVVLAFLEMAEQGVLLYPPADADRVCEDKALPAGNPTGMPGVQTEVF